MKTIKKNEDFRLVYKIGKSVANEYLVMYTINNDMESNRYGISVSKKVGNSCIRHKVKRRIKEICRLNDNLFLKSFDIVIIAREKAKNATYKELEKSFFELIERKKIGMGLS
ncbi:MAG: ribonuclease P protein component [Eubacteriales bacterium]|nr:ribonuclease P protein component [Eubacteriales bacterium]